MTSRRDPWHHKPSVVIPLTLSVALVVKVLSTQGPALWIGLAVGGVIGYNLAIRKNGRDMVRTGARRAIKGRW